MAQLRALRLQIQDSYAPLIDICIYLYWDNTRRAAAIELRFFIECFAPLNRRGRCGPSDGNGTNIIHILAIFSASFIFDGVLVALALLVGRWLFTYMYKLDAVYGSAIKAANASGMKLQQPVHHTFEYIIEYIVHI